MVLLENFWDFLLFFFLVLLLLVVFFFFFGCLLRMFWEWVSFIGVFGFMDKGFFIVGVIFEIVFEEILVLIIFKFGGGRDGGGDIVS